MVCLLLHRCCAQPHGKLEGAAFARFAFQPDAPAHHGNQTRNDGEAQSCATVSARGAAVGLRKRVEDRSLFFGSNTNTGVDDAKQDLVLSVGSPAVADLDYDFAGSSELYGVA